MICPDCGYNMVKDKSAYGYGCIICSPPEEDNPPRNEWEDLVRRAHVYHIRPLTPGEKAGIRWAEGEIKWLREAVENVLSKTDVKFANATYVGKDYTLDDLRGELRRAKEPK